jgi:hypothetical protein
MKALDAKGVYPSGDRLCEACENYGEDAVRRARQRIVSTNAYLFKTSPPLEATVDPDPSDYGEWIEDSEGGPPTFKLGVDADREFNVALLRIIEGRGSVVRSLSVVTNLSENAIKSRACRVRHDATDAELNPCEGAFEPHDLRYLTAVFKDSKDPAVREFIGTHNAPIRRRPDVRSSADKASA